MMSQTKHKKIESERLKNVGYHQKVYWKPNIKAFLHSDLFLYKS